MATAAGDPSFDTVSQSAHVWFCAFAVHLIRHGAFGSHPWNLSMTWQLILVGVVGLFCIAKEFLWDYIFESATVRGSSVRDFIFYFIGMVLGVLL